MATTQYAAGAHQRTLLALSVPPLNKGGKVEFPQRHRCESPSVSLFQGGKHSFQTISKRLTAIIKFTIVLLLTLVAASFAHAQKLPAAEKQKIEALIKQVGELSDANFIRNGSRY